MTYSLHPGAERDLGEALDFYADQAGQAVARRFIDEFERVVALLVMHPDLGTPSPSGWRTFAMRIFPYSIVYRNEDKTVRIIMVRHQRKGPRFGNDRR